MDNLGGHGRATHQFDDNVQFRARDQFAPVFGFENRPKKFRNWLLIHPAVTDRRNAKPKPKLQRDLFRIFGKNVCRPASNVAQPDNPDVHLLHGVAMIASSAHRLPRILTLGNFEVIPPAVYDGAFSVTDFHHRLGRYFHPKAEAPYSCL